MKLKKAFFRLSYVFAMIGGLVVVAGAWMLAGDWWLPENDGANIGAGIFVMAGTGMMGAALILCVMGWIAAMSGKNSTTETIS